MEYNWAAHIRQVCPLGETIDITPHTIKPVAYAVGEQLIDMYVPLALSREVHNRMRTEHRLINTASE